MNRTERDGIYAVAKAKDEIANTFLIRPLVLPVLEGKMYKSHTCKKSPFVMIRQDLLNDPEWRKLSSSAKVLYIYLRSKFSYKTHKDLTLSYSEMKDMMSPATVSKAFKELIDNKWVEKIKEGGLFAGSNIYKLNGQYKDFYYKKNIL